MSDTALMEPPVQQGNESAPPAASGDLNSLLASELSQNNPLQGGSEQQQKPQKTADNQPKDQVLEKPTSKPDAGAEPSPKKIKKAKWEMSSLDSGKEEAKPNETNENAQAEPAAQETAQSTDETPQNIRWKELREKERKLEQFEKETLPKLAEYEKTIEELKSKAWSDEDLQELQIMRQRFAEERLEHDKNFQREVSIPIQRSIESLEKVASKANLDSVQQQALGNAIQILDPVDRVLAIQEVLGNATVMADGELVAASDKFIDALIKATVETADLLHNQYWPREIEYRQAARDLANGARGEELQQQQAFQAKQEAELKEAREYIGGVLKANLKPLFDDKDLVIDGVHISQAMEEPDEGDTARDYAYRSYAGAALPFLAAKIQRLEAKLRETEGSLRARTKASPSLSGAAAPEVKSDGQQMSLQDALKADYKLR